MPKPCRIDPAKLHGDAPAPGCRLCELAATRADYAELWGEPPPVAAPPVKSKLVVKEKPAAPPPCPHLGKPTGDTVQCPTCSGVVHLKVFDCKIHGTCTIGRPAAGHGCCAGCPDRPR